MGKWWTVTHKGDQRARVLADRHYTRRKVGHVFWTRPGYNQVLYYEQANGRAAVFCWWRPKWEAGIPGTARMDKLRCIECTIFRNETRVRSSDLIREAVEIVQTWERALDVEWPDGLITGVSSTRTQARRAGDHAPGYCFIKAGWVPFTHPGKSVIADTWLRLPTRKPMKAKVMQEVENVVVNAVIDAASGLDITPMQRAKFAVAIAEVLCDAIAPYVQAPAVIVAEGPQTAATITRATRKRRTKAELAAAAAPAVQEAPQVPVFSPPPVKEPLQGWAPPAPAAAQPEPYRGPPAAVQPFAG